MARPDTGTTRQHILDTAELIIGQKGFTAVGLNEVLLAAGVPKGSFYHYFGSKDAFGVALLDSYFKRYVGDMQQLFASCDKALGCTLMQYWQGWRHDPAGAGRCLAVKLGAEVADLSEPMRLALEHGTAAIVATLAAALARGHAEGSLSFAEDPSAMALRLYVLWLGASVMAKITRSDAALAEVMVMTRQLLACPE